jgi:hypothetical protein
LPEGHPEEFLERLCLTASAGYGRAERPSESTEILHEFEEHLSEFLERLCLTASAGYGRAERRSEFREVLHEFEEHLSEFLECLCLHASAGYGRAERRSGLREVLHEFEERLSEFLECLCLTASAGYGRAERLYEVFEVLSPFFATPSLFLASSHQEGDTVAEVAPTRVGHGPDSELIHAPRDERVEHLLRLSSRRHVDPGLASCAQVRGSSRNRSIHSASTADASMLMRAISESEMRLARGERAWGQCGLQRSARTAKYEPHRSATAAASTSIVT